MGLIVIRIFVMDDEVNEKRLEAATAHIDYEVRQMMGALLKLPVAEKKYDGTTNNALLESVLVHALSLIGFMLPPKRPDDDIYSELYAKNWKPSDPDRLKNIADTINKRLQHLSFVRVDLGKKDWLYEDEILFVFNEFEEFAKSSARSIFTETAAEIRQQLNSEAGEEVREMAYTTTSSDRVYVGGVISEISAKNS